MLNVVHGESLRLCQWTGEGLRYRPFKIPKKGLKEFYGCYGSPSAAVAAILDVADKTGLTAEETHELLDVFSATLKRAPGKEDVKFSILPAGPWKTLKEWGGVLTLAEYHATYDHDVQVSIFSQVFPQQMLDRTVSRELQDEEDAGEKMEKLDGEGSSTKPPTPGYTSDPERAPNAPKKWRVNSIAPVGTQTSDMGETRLQMPRGITSVIEFLKEALPGSTSVVVYMDPESSTSFALGKPADWMGHGNKRVSDLLGKTTVYGQVTLYHKNKLRIAGNKKRARDPESDETASKKSKH
jgi:hypothetical protein